MASHSLHWARYPGSIPATDQMTRARSNAGRERSMSLKGAGYIVGAWEHPTRKASDKSVTLLHAECAKGALDDAGLTKDDVDAYYCAGDAPGLGPMSMIDYMGLKVRHLDST